MGQHHLFMALVTGLTRQATPSTQNTKQTGSGHPCSSRAAPEHPPHPLPLPAAVLKCAKAKPREAATFLGYATAVVGIAPSGIDLAKITGGQAGLGEK